MSMAEQENILVRIAALERQNRRLRSMMLGMVVLVIAGLCLSFVNVGVRARAPLPKRKAEKLVLHDEAGRERIVLKTDNDDPRIQLFNSDGKLVAVLGSKGGASLVFCDSKEIPRLGMYATDADVRLHFMDKNSGPRMELSGQKDPLLRFRDEKGRRILEVLKDGPKLTFFNDKGKPLFGKP